MASYILLALKLMLNQLQRNNFDSHGPWPSGNKTHTRFLIDEFQSFLYFYFLASRKRELEEKNINY